MIAKLLSNSALAGRYLKMMTLLPILTPLIQSAEATGQPGKEKKEMVLGAVVRTLMLLSRRGYLPSEEFDAAGVTNLAGELIDVTVEVMNNAGIFEQSKTGKKEKEKK